MKDDRNDLTDAGAARAGLVRLLDAWGGNSARWPDHVTVSIRELSARVPDAADLLRQARQLDAALDAARELAPVRDASRHAALADRIVAAAVARPRVQASEADASPVVQLETRRQAGSTKLDRNRNSGALPPLPAAQRPAHQRPALQRPATQWSAILSVPLWQQAGALMAACLLAGILIGGSIEADTLVRDIAGTTSATADFEATALAFGAESGSEDSL